MAFFPPAFLLTFGNANFWVLLLTGNGTLFDAAISISFSKVAQPTELSSALPTPFQDIYPLKFPFIGEVFTFVMGGNPHG